MFLFNFMPTLTVFAACLASVLAFRWGRRAGYDERVVDVSLTSGR